MLEDRPLFVVGDMIRELLGEHPCVRQLLQFRCLNAIGVCTSRSFIDASGVPTVAVLNKAEARSVNKIQDSMQKRTYDVLLDLLLISCETFNEKGRKLGEI